MRTRTGKPTPKQAAKKALKEAGKIFRHMSRFERIEAYNALAKEASLRYTWLVAGLGE